MAVPMDQETHSDASSAETVAQSVATVPRWRAMRFFSKYTLGVALIIMVAMIWVGASLWIQRIFGDLDYNKPYFLTYFNTTGFSFWNFGFLAASWRSIPWEKTDVDSTEEGKPPHERTELAEGEQEGSVTESRHPPYSRREILRCALIFCPLWFVANALFNTSLSATSVASNTILSSTSSVWALLLSKYFLDQDVIRWHKLCAVALTIGGSCLIGFSDSDGGDHHSLIGDVLALVAAFFYGAYTTTIKWMLPDEERYFMGMLFGFVGLINLFFMWPGLVVLDATGLEPFQLPNFEVFWSLAVNALIGTNLSDVMWAKSVVLTSPFVATLGLSLSTPIAMVADAVINGKSYNAMYISGALSVTAGFVVCNLRS